MMDRLKENVWLSLMLISCPGNIAFPMPLSRCNIAKLSLAISGSQWKISIWAIYTTYYICFHSTLGVIIWFKYCPCSRRKELVRLVLSKHPSFSTMSTPMRTCGITWTFPSSIVSNPVWTDGAQLTAAEQISSWEQTLWKTSVISLSVALLKTHCYLFASALWVGVWLTITKFSLSVNRLTKLQRFSSNVLVGAKETCRFSWTNFLLCSRVFRCPSVSSTVHADSTISAPQSPFHFSSLYHHGLSFSVCGLCPKSAWSLRLLSSSIISSVIFSCYSHLLASAWKTCGTVNWLLPICGSPISMECVVSSVPSSSKEKVFYAIYHIFHRTWILSIQWKSNRSSRTYVNLIFKVNWLSKPRKRRPKVMRNCLK